MFCLPQSLQLPNLGRIWRAREHALSKLTWQFENMRVLKFSGICFHNICLSLKKKKVLSDERLGAKLRVTENRCVLFNSLTYVYLALLPQH